MGECTTFCEALKALSTVSRLPSHDELITWLQFSEDDCEEGRFLGTWQDVQQRAYCGFCQLVVAAVTSSGGSTARPDQPIRVCIFPGDQSFRLSYPSRLGTRLAFVAADAQNVSGPDTARRIDPSGAQISRITAWLDACDKKHEACRIDIPPDPAEQKVSAKDWEFNESATSNFRVIDLERGCVVPVALDTRYVTLSYVWGNLPMVRLGTKNFEQLSTPGGFDSIRSQLPETIINAIDLSKAMGERYLWIDALCLVQDDDEDVALGVEMMNSIYYGSCYTLVAGSAANANGGLRETNLDASRASQIIKTITPDLKMAILHSIDWHINRSVYSERGWTLQELILPRRTVIFINGQVYFRCQEANWGEETWADKWTHWLDPDDSNISRIPEPHEGVMPSFWAYQKISEEYSRRQLRSRGDALRAIAGIARPLAAGMRTELIDGLPGYYLDHFLLFISSNGDLRRRAEFGSFSWAGWEGRIMWPRENYAWYKGDTEYTWKPKNIYKYLKYNRILEYGCLDSSDYLESLTSILREGPSKLQLLVQELPNVFPDLTEFDQKVRDMKWHGSSSGSCFDTPCWDWRDKNPEVVEEDEEAIEQKVLHPGKGFSIKEWDLANGQAEFERLLSRIDSVDEKLVLFNWIAVRNGRVSQARKNRSAVGPRPIAQHEEYLKWQYRFRSLKKMRKSKERRGDSARWRGMLGVQGRKTYNGYRNAKFPPYAVLHFITISFYLTLGASTSLSGNRSSPFDRIPGTPLLSATGSVVGSLHPDNVDLMAGPESKVECLVISRCNMPTVGSALLPPDNTVTKKPWKLLWVLHVVWIDGIAERRGVGQVLISALEEALEPQPEVKLVFLG